MAFIVKYALLLGHGLSNAFLNGSTVWFTEMPLYLPICKV